jgi:hypothetical protein
VEVDDLGGKERRSTVGERETLDERQPGRWRERRERSWKSANDSGGTASGPSSVAEVALGLSGTKVAE